MIHVSITLPPTLPVYTYIITTADCHVGVAGGHPLSRAGAWQVVVVDAAGVISRDGGGGV